jgi:hypothetical protein
MHADELDILQILRAAVGQDGRSITALSQAIYGHRSGLSKVLGGAKTFTLKALINAVRVLGVKGPQLRLWLAAYLVSKEIALLPLVTGSGMLQGVESPRPSGALPENDGGWRRFSRCEMTGRARRGVCEALGRASTPLNTNQVAGAAGIRPDYARTLLAGLYGKGLVQRASRMDTVPGLRSVHLAKVYHWSLSDAGRATLASLSE